MENDFLFTDDNVKEFKKSSKGFCHYTRFDKLVNILNSNSLWLCSMSDVNDRNEADLHKEEEGKIFSFSFCYTDAESIPLWYLYGGESGDGVRIRITADKILKLLKNGYIYIGERTGEENDRLLAEDEFELHYGWVYYLSGKNALRNGKNESKEKIDFNVSKNLYFQKDFAWRYEKEFRIVIVLREKANDNEVVKFKNFLEIVSEGMQICLAPEGDDRRDELRRLALTVGLKEEKVNKRSKLRIRWRRT